MGITRFSIANLLSQSTKKFRRETLLCSGLGNFRCRKILQKAGAGRGGTVKILRRNFLSHLAENFSRGTPWCFSTFENRKCLRLKEKAKPRYSVEVVLSHCTELFHRGALVSFGIFRVRKSLIIMKRMSQFSIKNLFCPLFRKTVWGNLLYFRVFLVSKKFKDKKWRGRIKSFRQFFCITAKKLGRKPNSVSLNSGIEKSKRTLLKRVKSQKSVEKNFCLAMPKNSVGDLSCVLEKVWYRKIFWIRRVGGSVTIFRRIWFVSLYQSFS